MSFDWYEKMDCLTITMPDEEFTWCYSYLELQNKMNDLCKNHILKKVYVQLISYVESLSHNENYYSFSYLGGPVIMIFDNVAVEFEILGVGLFRYRVMNLWEVKIKKVKDLLLGDMSSFHFYDLGREFKLRYEEQKITDVFVERIDYYPFDITGFDKDKARDAEKNNALPYKIWFNLANGVSFGLCADKLENFYIDLWFGL